MSESVQTREMTPEEKFRTLFERTAKLNDIASALLAPEWGAHMGIIPEGHPLHPGSPAALPETCNEPGPWGDAHAYIRPAGHPDDHQGHDGCGWRTGVCGTRQHGPHPGFTCAEVKQTRPFWEGRWKQEQQRKVVAEDRLPCPYCGDQQPIPRRQLVEHIARLHPEVETEGPAADEESLRLLRRESLLVLLTRLQRGRTLSAEEAGTLRHHVETEIREANTARSVAAGNKRHVQVMYDELQQASEAARRALEQRQEMATERHAIQEQRDAADRTRAEVQRDRDQHAAVLREVLGTFVHTVPGYKLARVRSGEVDVVTLEKWRSIIAPAAERPWWQQVAMYEQEAAEATRHVLELKDVIEQVRALATETRDGNASGSTDHQIGKYDVAVAVLALLDETEQTATEQPSYAQLHAAYTESWQLIEMQKQLLGKLRGLVITAYTDREDQGIRTERCGRCGRDHVAELYETFTKADEEYAVTFPATADGPARPGRLPETEA